MVNNIINLINILVFRIFSFFITGAKYNPNPFTIYRIFVFFPKAKNENFLKSNFYVASNEENIGSDLPHAP